ncbi:MAG: hypothetical protein ACQEQU_08215 [Spirochaetota bacterium]
MRALLNRVVAVVVACAFTGCSLVGPANSLYVGGEDPVEVRETVASTIEQQWDHINTEVEGLPRSVRTEDGGVNGNLVVDQMLQEEMGTEYLEFCYAVASGQDTDTVMEKAETLLSEEQYAQLEDQVAQVETRLYERYASRAFSIDDENREAFYKDLRKLVVSTSVLLTASVVYSAMPHIYFWGKISALAAVSVSAGAAAGTVISVYDWYVHDTDMYEAFNDWIAMITEEPYAAYLMATSVISLGQSMGLSPVSCSVIMGVFTVFNALNIVRDMLEAYGKDVEE